MRSWASSPPDSTPRATAGSSADVPPGEYDIVFAYTIPIERRGVAVRAGEVTTVTVAEVGQLRFEAFDAAGRPADPGLAIRRTPNGPNLAGVWGRRWIDLPAGPYFLMVPGEEEDIPAAFVITPGQRTTLKVTVP